SAELDRFRTVARLADDRDVVLGIEQRPEPRPHQHLVVGEHDPDHRGGHAATTRKPPSSAGPASSRPPVATTRSRIPMMPKPSSTAGLRAEPDVGGTGAGTAPPSSITSTRVPRSEDVATSTCTRAPAAAWRRTLLSASWTTR